MDDQNVKLERGRSARWSQWKYKKWPSSILEVELTGFPDGLHAWYKRKRGAKNIFEIFGLRN